MTPQKKECNLRPKLFLKDMLIYKRKDIPWKIKCRRLGGSRQQLDRTDVRMDQRMGD